MRTVVIFASVALAILLVSPPAWAQQEVPNPMAAHTYFVILITAAFLVWAASYSLHFYRDRADRRGQERESLVARRDALLDEFVELESAHQSGSISDARYRNRSKSLRSELARTIGRLESAPSKPKGATTAGRKRS